MTQQPWPRDTLPDPRASYMENVVATALLHGNTAATLNLETIARHNDWETPILRAEFERQEKAWLSKIANAVNEGGEGK